MPLASLEHPCRAFPPRGADPALAGRCFLAGSSSDHRPAQTPRDRRDRFHRSRQLFALVSTSRRIRDAGAGTKDPCSHSPEEPGLAEERPGRPLRRFAPPGGPFGDDPLPWPGWAARRCSPGVLSLQSLLHLGSGFGLPRSRALESRALSRASPGARSSRLHSARRTPTPGSRAQDPSIQRSIEPRGPPSSSRPAHRAFVECSVRQRLASPLPRRAVCEATCSCPLFGGTPRLPALGDRIPLLGRATAGPRRRSRGTEHQTPPLAGQAGDRTHCWVRSGRPIALALLLVDEKLSSRPRDC
jgi:hypothetical protein